MPLIALCCFGKIAPSLGKKINKSSPRRSDIISFEKVRTNAWMHRLRVHRVEVWKAPTAVERFTHFWHWETRKWFLGKMSIMLENGDNVRCKRSSSLSSDSLLIIDVRQRRSTFQLGNGSVIAVFHLSLTADCWYNPQFSYANLLMVLCHLNHV